MFLDKDYFACNKTETTQCPIRDDPQHYGVIFYYDSGVKSPGCGARLAYCTKNVRATDFCVYVLRGYQAKPGGFLRTWR